MSNKSSAGTFTAKLEIEVFGTDLDGNQFIEQTRTLTITRDGATIPLANKLAPDSELIIRNPATGQEALARVLDLIPNANFAHVYGVAFVEPATNLWQVQFPAAQSKKPIVMECGRCHAVDAILLGEIETQIFESKQTLTRHCECSNSPTVWNKTDRKMTEPSLPGRDENNPRGNISPIEERAKKTGQERRKEKRAAMKAAACIRFGGQEVMGESEDVSRGGFRFKGPKSFPEGMRIEASVPYAKNSNNIFVSGLIVYRQELPGDSYRYGVAYLKSVKKHGSEF